MSQSILRDRGNPFGRGHFSLNRCAFSYRKGIGLIFPNPDVEIDTSVSCAVTQTNPETLIEALGRVLSSLLGTNSMESLRAEIWMLFP